MKNIIKLIINYFKKLFRIKTEENNGSDESQNTVSGNTEEEDDCSKLIIIPSDEIGDGGEITFKTNL